ncbi:hypothetical protein A7D00_1337 [Trichophyton violaceum]|uniref:Uncharacterized protein n=1 Tax=Trichophyton violaceum TaxID=34388 RepID=A0A178FLA2_TRIVO|nr:hypothetical protein A7D00_1337 [Trichophyton violaceum]
MAHKPEQKEGSSSDSSNILSPQTRPTERSSSPGGACPPFWAPGDRPGYKGVLDRHRRKMRLFRSIRLDAKQLRHVLTFMQHNYIPEGVEWTSDILFAYVPRTFEGATTTEIIAGQALFHAITPSLDAIFQTTHSNVLALNKSPRYIVFEFFWNGSPPVVPVELQDLPSIKLTHEEPEEIYPDAVEAGWLGERRLVLVTAGHIVDSADLIQVQDEEQDNNTYKSQVVPEFERIGGIPLYRRGEPINPLPASLNETCLLETDQIPRSALRRVGDHVDCNRFNPDSSINYTDATSLSAFDPKLGDIDRLRHLLLEGGPIRAFKCGAASRYTTGFLCQVKRISMKRTCIG